MKGLLEASPKVKLKADGSIPQEVFYYGLMYVWKERQKNNFGWAKQVSHLNFYQSTEPTIYISTKCYKSSLYIWKLYFSYYIDFKYIRKVINRILWLYFSPSDQQEMHFHISDNQTPKLEYFEAQIQFRLSHGKKGKNPNA